MPEQPEEQINYEKFEFEQPEEQINHEKFGLETLAKIAFAPYGCSRFFEEMQKKYGIVPSEIPRLRRRWNTVDYSKYFVYAAIAGLAYLAFK